MKKPRHAAVPVLLLGLAVWWPGTAMAYLDAATGSMILQSVLGAIFAVGITIKLFWHRIKALFRRSNVSEPQQAAKPAPEETTIS